MSESLFDLSAQYDEMLRMGVNLTGEDPSYFMRARVDEVRRDLPSGWCARRILDFGCGTGESSAYLAQRFPGSEVLGVDTSMPAIDLAAQRYASARIRFGPLSLMREVPPFDLCYVNGVFHHIEPGDRMDAVRSIRNSLVPGGYFSLWENNPWNPGTRMVMRRIPFDRDAQTLSFLEAQNLVRQGGFRLYQPTRFLFYFPRSLSFLRNMERLFVRLPFGGQYCVLGVSIDC